MTDEEFVQRLIAAGWTEEEARQELINCDNDAEEAGYDGP